MPTSNSLPLDNPYPLPTPPQLSLVPNSSAAQADNGNGISYEDGALKIENADGSVTIDFNPENREQGQDDKGFYANLAKQLGEGDLEKIISDLLDGVERDEQSRKEWLETRAAGITLLGLKIEKPRTDSSSVSAPLEGMSTVRHPLLLGSTLAFQATARAELLPASGPVKIRNDTPLPPQQVLMATSAQSQLAASLQQTDELAQALEKDMNHYLTDTATEYVPDTDRMLFYIGFGGDGFKKVYNCPLRRRPVSESIDAEDLIVSNAATDLHNCGRVTHRIRMRKSTLRRMQILGVYRDVELNSSPTPDLNEVDKKKEEIAGIKSATQRPEDRDYEIYECYCELDLDQFAPKGYKGKGLPLPYRVTLEKESRQVLDIRRNWQEKDEQCLAKRFFVQFPFVRGLGFYGLGFIHILGNTTSALTAAWRLTLDSGMFANFPGFLYAKGLGRQNTNQIRIAPGTGMGMDVGTQQSIKDAIMPLPYKEVGGSFTQFITHIEELGDRLAANTTPKVAEGKQDAPVGTTLALIEQSTKIMDSAHKRLHAAQAEEFKLLKERFREDPEAFFRHNKRPTVAWQKDQFLEALDRCELVPVADPNNPTSLHRIAKGMIIKQLQQGSPAMYDPVAVDMRVLRIADIDPQGLFRPMPAQPPPDPRMMAIQAKAQAQQVQNQINYLEAQVKAATVTAQIADKEKDRASRERVEEMKLKIQALRLQQEQIIHAHDAERDAAMAAHEMHLENAAKAHELRHSAVEHAQDLQRSKVEAQHDALGGRIKTEQEITMERDRHDAAMQRDRERHDMEMQHAKEMHAAKLESARQLAKVKPKAGGASK